MNLTPQKEYYFKVNAENSGGMSTFSNTVKVLTPPSFPKIPTALSAKALSENSIQLRWKDKSHNETGFIIERTDYSSLIFRHIATLPTNTEVYTDTNLNSNIMYFYRIRSFNITGQSKLTSAVQAKTLMPRPAPPSSLKANLESEGKARIAWKDHSNLETGFTLEYANKFSNSFQVLKKVGKNITEVVVPLQYINVNYLFRIKAYNDTGSSKYSETISLFNHIYPPLLLRGKVKKHRTILLEWKDGSQYEENYIVEMRNSEDPKLKKIILPPNTERYEIGNLKENTLYYFRVYTIKNQFTSAYVDISLITPRTTFVIYPNPTFGKVGIKIEDDYLGKIYVDVFNNLGKEIVATTVEKTQLEITINFKLSDQPFGLYWIRVRRGSKVSIRSIIKE